MKPVTLRVGTSRVRSITPSRSSRTRSGLASTRRGNRRGAACSCRREIRGRSETRCAGGARSRFRLFERRGEASRPAFASVRRCARGGRRAGRGSAGARFGEALEGGRAAAREVDVVLEAALVRRLVAELALRPARDGGMKSRPSWLLVRRRGRTRSGGRKMTGGSIGSRSMRMTFARGGGHPRSIGIRPRRSPPRAVTALLALRPGAAVVASRAVPRRWSVRRWGGGIGQVGDLDAHRDGGVPRRTPTSPRSTWSEKPIMRPRGRGCRPAGARGRRAGRGRRAPR
jgi:hypothetical protein